MKQKTLLKAIMIFISFFFLHALISPVFGALVSRIFLSLYLIFFFRNNLFRSFKKINFKELLKYLIIFFCTMLFVKVLNSIIFSIFYFVSTNQLNHEQNIIKNPVSAILSTCLLAPLYEEILLRLNFRDSFKSKISFIIITGCLFGFLHLLSATNISELIYCIPYAILGMTLSYIYGNSDNISYSIIIHALNNLIEVILVLIGGTI